MTVRSKRNRASVDETSAGNPAPGVRTPAPIVLVPFDGDEVQAIQDGDEGTGEVWVVVKRVCEALGLQAHGQAEKLKDKPWAVTQMKCATGPDGKDYEMFCIALRCLPMWLATIEASRVAVEVRPKLEAFQVRCRAVLAAHFFKLHHGPVKVAPAPVSSLDEERLVKICTEAATRAAVEAVKNQGHNPYAPCIGKALGDTVNASLRAAARRMTPSDKPKSYRSILGELTLNLRSSLEFFGTHRGWADFPWARWPDLKARLEELRRLAERVGEDQQTDLFAKKDGAGTPPPAQVN